jgi:UDP-glucose/iron transport system ATP-binding protein
VSFFNIQALKYLDFGPINLQIEASEIIGLNGPSGSGKSRLLRSLADLDEHTGNVLLRTIEQRSLKAHEWRAQVALLSAETYWWLDTVGEHFKKFSTEKASALGFVNDVSVWPVSRLSSGEKQRLGLLRLLENEPDVLLLDEPTANLDPANEQLFENYVMNYIHVKPACAIWVSHDVEQLKRISQRQYKIQQGQLITEVNGI